MTVSTTPGGDFKGVSFVDSAEGTAYNQLNLSSLHLPLTDTVVPARGSSTPTFTRATAAWSFDNEGKLNLNVPSGCARFKGGRLVRNLVVNSSENITSGGKTAVTTPDATTVLCNAGSTNHYLSRAAVSAGIVGHTYLFTLRLQYSNHAIVQLFFPNTIFAPKYANFNLQTGELNNVSLDYVNVVSVSPGVWDVSYTGTVVSAGTASGIIAFVTNLSSSRLSTYDAVGTEEFKILRVQIENITGQADQTPSEYVSVGVLSSPYHGAGTASGADGCKWFPTNKDGSAIPSSTLEGYFAEPSRTNNCFWNRDLTNIAWTNTNITAAKTATGLDNVANSATRLTAAATDATITQLLTAATGTRTLSAYIKRVSGTGTISLTRDGGTNWTDITSSLVTGSWVLVQMTSDVGANPTVGIKIGTSGDVIDVDCVQDENGPWATSPILTTTAAVTRNADVLSYASAYSNLAGTALCSLKSDGPLGVAGIYGLTGDTNGRMCYWNAANIRTSMLAYDGTTTTDASGGGNINTGIRKRAVYWSGATMKACSDGSIGPGSAFDGTMGAGSTLFVGCDPFSTSQLSGTIREVHIWPTPLTDAQMKQVTT